MVKSSGSSTPSSGALKSPLKNTPKKALPNKNVNKSAAANSTNDNDNDNNKLGYSSAMLTSPYIPTYNAPSFNDPNSPMSKVPMALDDSVVNDNIYGSALPKGDFKKRSGNIIPKRNNKLLQGTNNSTIIASEYYATGQVHTLKPDRPQFDAPSTFQMTLPQAKQQQPIGNYAGQRLSFTPGTPDSVNTVNQNIPPMPSYPPQAHAQYQQYQQHQQYFQQYQQQYPQQYQQQYQQQYPGQGQNYAYPPQAAPAAPTTFIEGESPEQTHAAPKPAPAPINGSVDYLNYIASDSAKSIRKPVDSKLFVYAGVGVTVVITIVAIVAALSSQNDGPLAGLNRVQLSIANIQAVFKYANQSQVTLSRDETSALSEIILTINTQEKNLAGIGMGVGGNNKYKAAKPSKDIKQKLDDSRAQGKLDQDLPATMRQHLNQLIGSMKAISNKIHKKKQREVVDAALKDISAVTDRLDASIQQVQSLMRSNSAADASTIDRNSSNSD